MKYLIYELFSGVGFCNQLFSLETAIYLANISNRKLILLVRNPLCHCGKSSWNYGKFLDFFSDDYKEFLPHGLDVHYNIIPPNILNIINNEFTTKKLIYQRKFSQLTFVDNNLNTEKNREDIKKFASGRTIENLNFDDNQHYEYFYINQSNASRCFYNFYTTQYNYNIMNCIAKSLSILNYNISNIFNDINLPSEYVGVHFRFGDTKHDRYKIQSKNNSYLSNLDINKLKSLNTKIMIMCDRKDSLILDEFVNINYRYTDELIDCVKEKITRTFDNIKDLSVIKFLLEKLICDKSIIFYANEGSTVSNYINYIRYINNLDYCNLYVNNENMIVKNNQISWRFNKIRGHITWPTFWTDNIIKNPNTYKIITLTNNGYKHLTENLLISMKKCGFKHELKIYCIDMECYEYFKKNYPYNETELVNIIDKKDSQYSNWVEYRPMQSKDLEGRKHWANVTKYKIVAINNELRQNNDVIFIDGDIVVFKNFIADLYHNIYDSDLLIQNDTDSAKTANMCTGFFLMKSNNRTIECTDINKIDMTSFNNDQQYLRSCNNKLSVTYLNLNKYPNGKYYRTILPNNPYIIHFNHDTGVQKINRMKHFKYWYLNKSNYSMKLSEWMKYSFPLKDLIINASSVNGGDDFTILPIGVQHDYLKYIKLNDKNFLNHSEINSGLCLSSFSRNTDKSRRRFYSINRNNIDNIISNKKFITKFRSDINSYFKTIGKFKFVICPEGNGIDTHRLWETLYSKGIPIVEDNVLMRKKCEGLPILWTNNYSDLTEEYLINKYNEMLNTTYDFSLLYLSFYNKDNNRELMHRSEFWCNKRGLNDLFYKYYSLTNESSNTNMSNVIINNVKNNMGYFGLKDSNGIHLDEKLDLLFNKKNNGVFIDVGAHDGILQSNTLFFENKREWKGIVITPNYQKYTECLINRSKSKNECFACVGPNYKQSTVKGDFWRIGGSINGTRSKSNRIESVNCCTLSSILEKNLLDFEQKFNKNLETEIDFIKIDTGAFEYDILLGLDLSRFQPAYILVEILTSEYNKIIKYLSDNGYKLECNFSNYTKENNKNWDGTHNDYLFRRVKFT